VQHSSRSRLDDTAALPLPNTQLPIRTTRLSASTSRRPVLHRQPADRRARHTGLAFANPSGTTLRILDDGGLTRSTSTQYRPPRRRRPSPVAAQRCHSSRWHRAYSGAISFDRPAGDRLAGRIAVNAGLLADPSRLVVYQTSPLTPGAIRRVRTSSTMRSRRRAHVSPAIGHRHQGSSVRWVPAASCGSDQRSKARRPQAAADLKQGQAWSFQLAAEADSATAPAFLRSARPAPPRLAG